MKTKKSRVTVGRVTFVSESGSVNSLEKPARRPFIRKGLEVQAKVLGIEPDAELNQESAYENSGHWRTDRYFRLQIEVNGKILPSDLHLYRIHHGDDRPVRNYESGWVACLDMNVEAVPGGYSNECLECHGNRGRSGPLTSGLTNRAVGIVVVEAMKGIGYEITTKYHDYINKPDVYISPLAVFTMRVPEAEELGQVSSNGRHGRLIGIKRRVCCPLHGDIVQKEMEPAF